MARLRQKLGRAEWAKLPQDRQEDYQERDGAFYLDTEDAEALRTALERQKGEATELRRKLDAMRDVDPDEYQRLKTASEQAARDKELAAGNYEKLRAQDVETHAKELKAREELAGKLRTQLEDSLVDGEITRAIMKYKDAKVTPLLLGAKRHAKAMEIGGKLRGVVLDDKGEPRLKAGAKNADDYMTYDDLIGEMRNDKEWAGNFPAGTVAPVQSPRVQTDHTSRAKRDVVESIAQQVRDGATKIS